MYKIYSAALETVAGVTSKFPESALPEYAFAGKSNVGKSSLINGLMMRKSLARTSQTPGKTQTVNFYNVNERLYFVDLPGYGYTKASLKAREEWGRMVERYLRSAKRLELIFILVDIRHAPGANDKKMLDWVKASGKKSIIIATKADKIKRSQLGKHIAVIRKELELAPGERVIPFSAVTKEGRDEIYEVIGNGYFMGKD